MTTNPAKPTVVSLQLTPPGETEPQTVEVNVLGFTLAERNLAKKALAKLTDPDFVEIMAVNAWVTWRRTHPDCNLDDWFGQVTFGDIISNPLADVADQPLLTPDEYDPEA